MPLRLPPFSFQLRLFLLVLLALLPALGLILYASNRDRDRALADAQDKLLANGEIGARSTSLSITVMLAQMRTLSVVPQILESDDEGCGRLFAANAADFAVREFYIARADGSIVCADPKLERPGNVAEVETVRAAIASHEPSLGDFSLSASGGPVVSLAVPILDRDGIARGVVGGAFDLAVINAAPPASGLAAGGVTWVADRNGVVLFVSPGGAGTVGAALPDAALREAVAGQAGRRAIELKATDGTRRIYGVVPLEVPGVRRPYIIVGEPTSSVYADANEALRRNLIGLGVVTVLAFGAAWFLGQALFVRRVKALVGGTRQVAAGNFEARVPIEGRDELSGLAAAFNEMTDVLSSSRQQMEEREAEFRAVFDAASDGLVINDPETGLIVEVNPALCRMHGWEREAMIGRPPARFIAPESRPVVADITSVALSGRTFQSRSVNRRQDGSTFDVAITGTAFQFRGKPHLLSIVRDVSAQVSAERALQSREAQFRGVFESTNDGLVINDEASGAILEVNPAFARMHGYEPAEMVGMEGPEFIHSDSLPLLFDFRDAVRAGRTFRTRAVDLRKDGSTFHVEVTGSGLEFQGRRRLLGVVRDVSEQVEAERMLEERVTDRTRELTTLLDVAQTVGSTLEIRPLIRSVLGELNKVIDYASATVVTFQGETMAILESRPGDATDMPFDVVGATGMTFPLERQGVFWDAIVQNEPVLIDDVRGPSAMAAEFRATVGSSLDTLFRHVGAWMAVPLSVKGEPVGLLSVGRPETGYFGLRHMELLRAFAAHASVALENARLFDEVSQRARETETLARIAAGFTLAGGLEESLAVLAREAAQATGAGGASITLVANQQVVGTGTFGLPAGFIDAAIEALNAGAASQVFSAIEQQEAMEFPDARRNMGLVRGWERAAELLQDYEADFILITPMIYRGEGIGALILMFTPAVRPGPQTKAFIRAIADQTAVGIQNLRLYTQTERRAAQNEALARIAASVTLDQPLPVTLETIADRILAATNAIACTVNLLDPVTGDYPVLVDAGFPAGLAEAVSATIGPTARVLADRAVQSESWLVIPDAPAAMLANERLAPIHQFLNDVPWKAVAIQPLIYRGSPVGALTLCYPIGTDPTTEDRQFIQALSDQAALAVENAWLFAQTESRSRENAALAAIAANVSLDQSPRTTLDAMAASALSASSAVAAAIALVDLDRDRIRLSGGAGLPAGFVEALQKTVPASDTFNVEALERGEQIFLENARTRMLANPTYHEVHPFLAAAGTVWEHIQVVPILFRGRPVGGFNLAYPPAGRPGPEETRLLGSIAQQMAIAIENILLFEQAEERARENAALAAIAANVTLDQPVTVTLSAIAEQVVWASGAEACAIYLRDEPGGDFNVAGASAVPEWLMEAVLRIPARAESARMRAIRDNRPVIVEDLREHLRVHPGFSLPAERIDELTWRTTVYLPVRYRAESVGAMAVGFPTVFEPPAELLRTLSTLADQASIGIANVRLFEQTEGRAREQEALAAIAAALKLEQPIERTLDAIAENVVRAVGAHSCAVYLKAEGSESFDLAGSDSIPDWLQADALTLDPRPGSARYQAIRERRILVLPDVREHFRNTAVVPNLVRRADEVPWRTAVNVPIIYRAEPVGLMTVNFDTVFEPDERLLQTLAALADHASIAIANARLFAETDRKAKEQAALARIATALAGVQSLDSTLDTLTHAVVEATEAAACSVVLFDPNSLQVTDIWGHGLPGAYLDGIRESFRNPGWARQLRRFLESDNVIPVTKEGLLGEPLYEPIHATLRNVAWDASVIVPLRYKGRTVGGLNGYFLPGDEPDAGTVELLRTIAGQASVAVENARLYAETERRAAEQEAIASLASELTYDQPLSEFLDAMALNVVRSTRALACSVILSGPGRPISDYGQYGLPDGYFETVMRRMEAEGPSAEEVGVSLGRMSVQGGVRRAIAERAELEAYRRFLPELEWDVAVRVPMTYRGETRGAIVIYLPPGPEPDEDERRFYRAIANQASVATENARLYSETVKRMQEQEALATIASTLTYDRPLTTVLDTLAADVCRGTGALAAAVFLLDDDAATMAAGSCGIPEGYMEARSTVRETFPGYWHGRDEETEITVTHDARAVVRATPSYGPMARFFEENGWDVIVRVPFAYRGTSRGRVVVYFPEGVRVGDSEIRFYRAIADQASVAAENARLFGAVAERTRQLAALYRADEALHRSLKTEEVLAALLEVVVDTTQADDAVLILWEPGTVRPRLTTCRTKDRPDLVGAVEDSIAAAGREAFGQASAVRAGILVVTDTEAAVEPMRSRTFRVGVRALMEVPIVVGGQLFGILDALYRRPRQFSAEEQRLFVSLAKRAALAIENAELYEQAQALAAVEERQRLARELHDSVSQALYGIALGSRTARTLLDRDPARAVEPVDYVLSLAEAGLAEMRALIFELRPESLAQEGLVAALEKQIASTRARYGIAVEAELGDEPDAALRVKEAVYRVAQEALHNVVKHARATRVQITVIQDVAGITLDLRDDGQGFDPEGEFPGHLGLRSMRERVTKLGGSLRIRSVAGEGTHLVARVPSGTVE